MKTIRNLFFLALAFVVVGGGLYEWWNLFGRFQPHPITTVSTAASCSLGKSVR